MDVATACLRGLGYSILPAAVTLLGACLFRIVWVYTVFQSYGTLTSLYLSYPISWLLTTLILWGCYWFIRRRIACQKEKA